MTHTENPAKPCAICEANARLCKGIGAYYGVTANRYALMCADAIERSCTHAKPDARAGGTPEVIRRLFNGQCVFLAEERQQIAAYIASLSGQALPAVGAGGTPRTDAVVKIHRPFSGSAKAETAFDTLSKESGKLERELTAALAANESLRADALEEAARICDPDPTIPPDGSTSYLLLRALAERIRALKRGV